MKCQLTGKEIQVDAIYELLPYQKEIKRRAEGFMNIKAECRDAKFAVGANRYELVYEKRRY